jgi:hypothetical protein
MITITVNQGRFHVYGVYKLPYLTFAQALRNKKNVATYCIKLKNYDVFHFSQFLRKP